VEQQKVAFYDWLSVGKVNIHSEIQPVDDGQSASHQLDCPI
jgi:hypothetical protein